jgi:hypothetical protein
MQSIWHWQCWDKAWSYAIQEDGPGLYVLTRTRMSRVGFDCGCFSKGCFWSVCLCTKKHMKYTLYTFVAFMLCLVSIWLQSFFRKSWFLSFLSTKIGVLECVNRRFFHKLQPASATIATFVPWRGWCAFHRAAGTLIPTMKRLWRNWTKASHAPVGVVCFSRAGLSLW